MCDFCHLHCHSRHSFFDGLNTSADLVKRAADLGQPGIALTDHGNMYGAVQFFNACQEHDIKGVIGMEIYEAVPHEWILERDKDIMKTPFGEGNRYFHLTLWCQDEIGWKNLCALHTLSYTSQYKLKNRNQALIDRASMEKHSEGLMVGLGCLASRVNQAFLNEDEESAYEASQWYKDVFEDRVYCEIMGNLPEQQSLIRQQRRLAKRLGVKVVATNDVHYVDQSDGLENGAHHLVVQARMYKKKDQPDKSSDKSDAGFGSWYGSDEFYLKSKSDMLATGGITEADLDVSGEILSRVDFDFAALADPSPPVAPIPEVGEDPDFEEFLEKSNT
jgi:DNA polymerase-3 subunit alpha